MRAFQKPRSRFVVGGLVVLAVAAGLILSHRLAIYDWLRLRGYQPSSTIAVLATDDTMTPSTRRVFYVNHPLLQSKSAFAPNCPRGTEQTVVLGCYHSDQAGIYLLNATDSRLNGIEQVTAAHETLHAEYDRLQPAERHHVDAMLVDYYNQSLSDPTIKNIIAAYRKTEPHDVMNEMHSVFGTEVGNLPPALESYYGHYFTNRAAIVADYNAYEAEFTSRQATIAQDDAQLKAWKQQINSQEADLTAKEAAINAEQAKLQQERASGNIAAYNAGVAGYNQQVTVYNAEIQSVKDLVAQYNQLVASRNQLALEEQQLTSDISSSVPAKK